MNAFTIEKWYYLYDYLTRKAGKGMGMRKTIISFLIVGCLVSFVFSVYFAYRVVHEHAYLPFQPEPSASNRYRIAVISKDTDTPFWSEVKAGVRFQANRLRMDILFYGSYRPNPSELLKNMDIAIASKVDGIIVEGMDTPEFAGKVLSALEKGIPVITIATDSPSSLRRAYVGSNDFQDGVKIGTYIKQHLSGHKQIGAVLGDSVNSMENLRLKGLISALKDDADLQVVMAEPSDVNDVNQEINSLLNEHPQVRVLVGLTSDAGVGIVKTVKNRAALAGYSIYSFDDTPDIIHLLRQGFIKATLQQQPRTMGEKSVSLIGQWLSGSGLPLENNYFISSNVIVGEGEK
ncbi:substrate-binding domain-containing protein [Ferviditalea candida]|uniref:Substrate-binding domain-containing protein n=1 Tax=Ferviditalea candida TaxID=3108399 RepID=A0ABU5ZFX4_9BACL|nr:substrate-binding domain-containing protein [Paenibacillaceae bacterium T2]